MKQILQEESDKVLQQLKMRIVELENELQLEKQKNAHLTSINLEQQEQLNKLREDMQRDEVQHDKLLKTIEEKDAHIKEFRGQLSILQVDKENLSKQISQLSETHKKQNNSLLEKEIDATREFIEKSLQRLDNPNNLGEQSATFQDVIDDSDSMIEMSKNVVTGFVNGNNVEFVDSLKSVSSLTITLLDDIKGTSRKIEDETLRQMFLDAARTAAESIGSLISSLNGTYKDGQDKEETKKDVEENYEKLKNNLTGLKEVTQKAIISPKDDHSDELASIAEKELLEAARIIEQAAQQLLLAKSKTVNVSPGMPNIADAILEAAMAITKATAVLVNAATVAQKERESFASSDPSSFYKKNSWSQGLISAAKSVANSTFTLVQVANDAVEGKLDGESVIAATKSVASSTAQLVAACRSKSDPNSQSQRNLEQAAKMVAQATNQLLLAAQSVQESKSKKEVPEDFSKTPAFQLKVIKMELQAQLLRLEKEMSSIQTKLYTIQKQEYK